MSDPGHADSHIGATDQIQVVARMPYTLILISMLFLVAGVNSTISLVTRESFDFGLGVIFVIVGIGLLRLSDTARKSAVLLLVLGFALSLLAVFDLRPDQRWWSPVTVFGRRLSELSVSAALAFLGISMAINLLAAALLSRKKLRSLFANRLDVPADRSE